MSNSRAAQVDQSLFYDDDAFNAIIPAIRNAEKKRDKFAQNAKSQSPGNLEYVKLHALRNLLNRANEKIDAYCRANQEADAEPSLSEKIQFLVGLNDAVNEVWVNSNDAVSEHRHYYRDGVSSVAKTGIFAGTAAAFLTNPLGVVGGGLLSAYVVNKTGHGVTGWLGLDNNETATKKCIMELKHEISKTINSLRFANGETRAFQAGAYRNVSEDESSSTGFLAAAARHVERRARPRTSVPAALDVYHPATESYIDRMRSRGQEQGLNADKVARLNLTAEEDKAFEAFIDPITQEVCNIPVTVYGHLFDLDSLLQLPTNSDGARKDPLSRYTFYPRDIQPADAVADQIATVIRNFQQQREQANSAADIAAAAATSAAS